MTHLTFKRARSLCMDVCYVSSYFRDTLHDQIGSAHVSVYVNERVSSRFWYDSCCMTKYDQITSRVSHRPITEGTDESSSRNYVFIFLGIFLKNFGFLKKLNFLNFFERLNFLWRQFRVGVIYGKWVCLWPYMVPSCGLLGWIKLITPYY